MLLVHPGGPFWRNKDEHAWSIPKGEHAEDEEPRQAAEREFGEELGMPVPAGPWLDLGEVRQSGGKWVRAWAVEVDDLPVDEFVSNEFEVEWPPRSGQRRSFPEVDRAEWTDVATARQRLVQAQVQLVERLLATLGVDVRTEG